MKQGLICLLVLFLLQITCLIPESAQAECLQQAETVSQEIVDRMLLDAGVDNVQALIDKKLSVQAGISAEWRVIALSQRGCFDFSAYAENLQVYLRENETKSAASRQKYALALAAAGADDLLVTETARDTIGQQGIMSWIYGLHLINNGYAFEGVNAQTVTEKLLSLQLADGGWAIFGSQGDADVTAMTLQALAPYYEEQLSVQIAAEKALALLSSMQLDDGSYASFGKQNPESTAQVLIALAELGIDGLADERFIKNENTLLDGMMLFCTEPGLFSHTLHGTANENAATQVLFALTAYQRSMQGENGVYRLDRKIPATGNSAVSLPRYKVIALLAVFVLFILTCAALYFAKKRHPKNYVFATVAVVMLCAAIVVTDFQTADSYYSGQAVAKKNPVGQIEMTIRCDAVKDRSEGNKYIPSDGIILERSSFAIEAGDTVYTVLTDAAREKGLHIEASGPNGMLYVEGIAHLYEFSYGDLSGWVYTVNGQRASEGCDQYVLKNGDVVEWHYSLQMGNDID